MIGHWTIELVAVDDLVECHRFLACGDAQVGCRAQVSWPNRWVVLCLEFLVALRDDILQNVGFLSFEILVDLHFLLGVGKSALGLAISYLTFLTHLKVGERSVPCFFQVLIRVLPPEVVSEMLIRAWIFLKDPQLRTHRSSTTHLLANCLVNWKGELKQVYALRPREERRARPILALLGVHSCHFGVTFTDLSIEWL